MKTLLCLLLGLALWPVGASAAGIERLKTFIAQTRSASATFEQTVLDRQLKPVQKSSGSLAFSRPGKFRWLYERPYPQQIIGDGSRLYLYDPDLNQVTIRKLDRALGSSPAALLAGSNDIEQHFSLANLGQQEGLDWLEATPRDKEAGFERVRMGFDAQGLVAMELRDHFGQTTVLRFSAFQRNPPLPPETFRFVAPRGADVLGD